MSTPAPPHAGGVDAAPGPNRPYNGARGVLRRIELGVSRRQPLIVPGATETVPLNLIEVILAQGSRSDNDGEVARRVLPAILAIAVLPAVAESHTDGKRRSPFHALPAEHRSL